jgi:hypothetical protein
MDRIDTQIITQLQADGRLSITELAERVGLTPPPAPGGFRGWRPTASSPATPPGWTPRCWDTR